MQQATYASGNRYPGCAPLHAQYAGVKGLVDAGDRIAGFTMIGAEAGKVMAAGMPNTA